MSKIQNEDIKSSAQLIAAGGSASQLPNDTKIYITANSINKTLNQAIIDQDIGGAAGGPVNLITNSTADVNGNGAVAYADAAGTSPVDGTGGSPTVTIARTTTTPLRGAGSFLFTKPASNVQGQGFSILFDCPLAFRAKVLQIQFSYLVASGTFAAGSQSTNSDITVWVVGVTSGRVSQPTTFKLFSNSTTIADTFISNFQTSAEDTQYRLCFHVGSTSASAFSLEFDDIIVSPTTLSYGTPISDWVDAGPITITSTGTNPTKGTTTRDKVLWRRVGDSMELIYQYAQSTSNGSDGTGNYLLGLPSGYQANTSLVPAFSGTLTVGGAVNAGNESYIGSGAVGDGSGSRGGMNAFLFSSTQFRCAVEIVYSAYDVFGSGLYRLSQAKSFGLHVKVPIQGWSAQVQSSDVNDQRIVALDATRNNTSQTILASGWTKFVFDTRNTDTHAALNISTGDYTIPVSGVYDISGMYSAATLSGLELQIRIYVDGVADVTGSGDGSTDGRAATVKYSRFFNAGQVVSMQGRAGGGVGDATTLTTAGNRSRLCITRVANPASITSTESIAFRAERTTAVAVTNTYATLVANTKVFDTHNAYNTSTGIFTAPAPGIYSLCAQSSVDPSSGQEVQVRLFAGGVAVAQSWASTSDNRAANVSAIVRLNAGDQVFLQHQSPVTLNTVTTAGARPFISGARIGI